MGLLLEDPEQRAGCLSLRRRGGRAPRLGSGCVSKGECTECADGSERKGGVKGDHEVLGFSKTIPFVEGLLCMRI